MPDPNQPIYVSDDETNPKTRLGQAKPSVSAIPQAAILHCAMAMMDGVAKYGLYNWREKDVPARIYIDAAYRHLAAWTDGQEYAEDSGVHHLGHVMACCCIILDAQEHGCLTDDRGAPGPFAEVAKRMARDLSAALENKRPEDLNAARRELREAYFSNDEPFNRIIVNHTEDQ